MSTRQVCDLDSEGGLYGLSLAKLTLNVAAGSDSDTEEEDWVPPMQPTMPPTMPPQRDAGSNDDETRASSEEGVAPAAALAAPPQPVVQPMEAFDPSQPMRNDGPYWQTTIHSMSRQLDMIATSFINPDTNDDDQGNWMMALNVDVPTGEVVNGDFTTIRKVASTLQRIIENLTRLAIITPLSAELLKPGGPQNELRAKVSSMCKRIAQVCDQYKKVWFKPRHPMAPMQDTKKALSKLKDLMNTEPTHHRRFSTQLTQATKNLQELGSHVQKYATAEVDAEPWPDWYTSAVQLGSQRIPEQIKQKFKMWKLERPGRILDAMRHAELNYVSMVELRKVVKNLQNMVNESEQGRKGKRQKQSDGASSSHNQPPVPPAPPMPPVPPVPSTTQTDTQADTQADAQADTQADAQADAQVDAQALATEAFRALEGPLLYISAGSGYENYKMGLQAVERIANNSSVFEQPQWFKLVESLRSARMYGRYSGSDAVAEREFKAVQAIRVLLEKAATVLSRMNTNAAEYWEKEQPGVSESTILEIQTKADEMLVVAADLQREDYFDLIQRGIEAVRIIATRDAFEAMVWDTVANALTTLYTEGRKPRRPSAVRRLIEFFEGNVDTLKQKDANTAAWVAYNVSRFSMPGEFQSGSPDDVMETGAAADDLIEEEIEVYSTDFESGSESGSESG